jgi:predicted Zn-dependent peptidase
MSSRLFQRIREQEGLCYYIGAGHGAATQYGTIYLRAGMDKGRFSFAKQRMIEELDIMTEAGITAQEFDTTLNYLRGQVQMGIESSDSLAHFVGKQQLLYGEITTLEEQLDRYESLTLDQVNGLKGMFASDQSFGFWIE